MHKEECREKMVGSGPSFSSWPVDNYVNATYEPYQPCGRRAELTRPEGDAPHHRPAAR
jgi:hypothetical protein